MARGGGGSLDGRVLRFHGFLSQGHPSVPFILALPVSETDVPKMEEGRLQRMTPRWRSSKQKKAQTDVAEMDVPETKVFFLMH